MPFCALLLGWVPTVGVYFVSTSHFTSRCPFGCLLMGLGAGWAVINVARVTQTLCDPGRSALPGLWFLPALKGQQSGDAIGISPMGLSGNKSPLCS